VMSHLETLQLETLVGSTAALTLNWRSNWREIDLMVGNDGVGMLFPWDRMMFNDAILIQYKDLIDLNPVNYLEIYPFYGVRLKVQNIIYYIAVAF